MRYDRCEIKIEIFLLKQGVNGIFQPCAHFSYLFGFWKEEVVFLEKRGAICWEWECHANMIGLSFGRRGYVWGYCTFLAAMRAILTTIHHDSLPESQGPTSRAQNLIFVILSSLVLLWHGQLPRGITGCIPGCSLFLA